MASAAEQQTQPYNSEPALISREPWWAEPPQPGQRESDLQWGYLEVYADGRFRFDPTPPSRQEIRERKSCWLSRDTEMS